MTKLQASAVENIVHVITHLHMYIKVTVYHIPLEHPYRCFTSCSAFNLRGGCIRRLTSILPPYQIKACRASYHNNYSKNFEGMNLANQMWFSKVCTFIDNGTCNHIGQNVVDSEQVHNKF